MTWHGAVYMHAAVRTCGGGREAIAPAAVARHGLGSRIRTVVTAAAADGGTTAVGIPGLLQIVIVQIVPRLVGAQRACGRVAGLLTEAAGAARLLRGTARGGGALYRGVTSRRSSSGRGAVAPWTRELEVLLLVHGLGDYVHDVRCRLGGLLPERHRIGGDRSPRMIRVVLTSTRGGGGSAVIATGALIVALRSGFLQQVLGGLADLVYQRRHEGKGGGQSLVDIGGPSSSSTAGTIVGVGADALHLATGLQSIGLTELLTHSFPGLQ